MLVFRVVIATEDVTVPDAPAPFAGIQHVVYIVAPNEAAIPAVLKSDPVTRHLKSVPRISWWDDHRRDIPTDLPLWQVKIGPDTMDACLFTVVAADDPAEIPAKLLTLYELSQGVLEWVLSGWYRVAPRPIDLTRPGVY